MGRSKSSAGYPEAFTNLIVQVGKLGKEVWIPVEGLGVQVTSLRTTLQCFFAAVKREGGFANADKFMQERAMYAEKIIVRAQGLGVLVSHRDNDGIGSAVNNAIAKAIGQSVARHDGPTPSTNAGSARNRDGPERACPKASPAVEALKAQLGDPMTELQGLSVTRVEVDGKEVAVKDLPKGEYKEVRVTELVAPQTIVLTAPPVRGLDSGVVINPTPGGVYNGPTPTTLLDLVSAEGSEQSAPRPAVTQKYSRKDGQPYPEEADGEPTWGFNADNEPKRNQYF